MLSDCLVCLFELASFGSPLVASADPASFLSNLHTDSSSFRVLRSSRLNLSHLLIMVAFKNVVASSTLIQFSPTYFADGRAQSPYWKAVGVPAWAGARIAWPEGSHFPSWFCEGPLPSVRVWLAYL